MSILSQSDLSVDRIKIKALIIDDRVLRREQFEKNIAEFLRTARRREDLYFRIITQSKIPGAI